MAWKILLRFAGLSICTNLKKLRRDRRSVFSVVAGATRILWFLLHLRPRTKQFRNRKRLIRTH